MLIREYRIERYVCAQRQNEKRTSTKLSFFCLASPFISRYQRNRTARSNAWSECYIQIQTAFERHCIFLVATNTKTSQARCFCCMVYRVVANANCGSWMWKQRINRNLFPLFRDLTVTYDQWLWWRKIPRNPQVWPGVTYSFCENAIFSLLQSILLFRYSVR